MNPSVAVQITSVDKTEAGQKAAEARFGKFAKKAEKLSGDGGLGKLGKQLEHITRLGRFGQGFEGAGRGLLAIGEGSAAANENVAALARGVFTLGGTAPAAFGAVAEGAALAAGATAALALATVGLGVAGYKLGEKWAKTGGQIGRAAAGLGVTTDWLQSTQGAAERFGVTADQTAASVDGLATTLYDARYGANNLALGAMNQLGVKLKTTKDGAVDTAAAFDDITDAIARQKDPMVQRKLASIFGLSAMLPAIREGGAKLNAARADYLSSDAALSADQVAQAKAVEEKTVAFHQRLGSIEKKAGMLAMPFAGAIAGAGSAVMGNTKGVAAEVGDRATRAIEAFSLAGATTARDLVKGGSDAGAKLVEGAERAARSLGGDVASSASRFFQALGFSPAQARGMTAGAYAESGLNAGAVNPKSGAFGIGQWLGGRKAELLKRYGPNPSFDDQLAFMGWELTHSEKRAGDAILGAPTASDAMETYVRRFMRPAAGAETSGDISRGEHFLARAETAPAKARVEITLKGAPPGTVAKASGDPGVDVDVAVHRSLEGAP